MRDCRVGRRVKIHGKSTRSSQLLKPSSKNQSSTSPLEEFPCLIARIRRQQVCWAGKQTHVCSFGLLTLFCWGRGNGTQDQTLIWKLTTDFLGPRILGCAKFLELGEHTCFHNHFGCSRSTSPVRKSYTWPGLNWRPSACEADVIATRPRVLVTMRQSTLIQTQNTFLPLWGHVFMFLGFLPSFFFACRGLCGSKGPRQRP